MKPNLRSYIGKHIIFLVFLFHPFITQAQKVKLSLSKEFSITDFYSIRNGVYKIGNFYYREELDEGRASEYTSNLKKVRFSVNIYKCDDAMKEVKKISLGVDGDDLRPYYPKLVLFNNKLLFFYFKVQEDNQVKLFMMDIDTATLADAGTRDVCTIPADVAFKSSAISKMQLHYCISPDKSKLLLVRCDEYSEIFTCVFDTGLAIIRKHLSGVNNLVQFRVGNIFMDNNANEYIGYMYNDTKQLHKYGILMENGKKDAFWEVFNTGESKPWITAVSFGSAVNNSKVYVYANYHNGMEEGIKLAEADGEKLITTNENFFLYSQDLKEKIYKQGFGQKNKNVYSINDISYAFTELGNGTIALTGYPSLIKFDFVPMNTGGFSSLATGARGYSVGTGTVGSIINVFIKNGQGIFKTIDTKQTKKQAGGCIVFADKDNLVCIYNGNRETFPPTGNDEYDKRGADGVVLGECVANSDGVVISKRKIADDPDGKNYYFIANYKALPNNRYLLPVGRDRMNLAKAYTEIVQWAILEIQ